MFLVGASGSGKSTTMRLLIKESEPTSGEIRVAGRDLAKIPRGRVPYYRRNLGVVFQDYKLLPNRTVHDNVAYALQVTGGSRREIRNKVPDILRLTGLSTKLHNYPDQLSGGEQQRVADRSRVRQPSAAADRRRAHRQPGPRDLDRDHAADLPDQPHRHDRARGHARRGDGRPDAPARDRALEGRIVRDEQAGAYAARESTREFAIRMRSAQG